MHKHLSSLYCCIVVYSVVRVNYKNYELVSSVSGWRTALHMA